MSTTLLPIFRRRVIRDDRQNVLVHFRFDDKSTGNPIDLSGYTLAGKVALAKGSAELALITFDNDLPNGLIKGYVGETNSKAVVAAAVAASASEVYWDIKATPSGGEGEQWFEGTASISKVVTP